MDRMDFYNRFKDDISTDWSLDLYTEINIGQQGHPNPQACSFSSPFTEGLYIGYCLSLNPSKGKLK